MSIQQRDVFIKNIFSTVAPYVDILSSAFSFGFDHYWRRYAISHSGIGTGERVLDVCTGTGELALLLSKKVGPGGLVTGADFCEEMLDRARMKAGPRQGNLVFLVSDAKHLPFPDHSFDTVTVSFGMRNIPDTAQALNEIRRVLKPQGKFVCLELTRPRTPWIAALYEWYVFKIMPLIGNMVVKARAPYTYLPSSIKAYYPPDQFRDVIAAAGFSAVSINSLTFGIATLYQAVNNA